MYRPATRLPSQQFKPSQERDFKIFDQPIFVIITTFNNPVPTPNILALLRCPSPGSVADWLDCHNRLIREERVATARMKGFLDHKNPGRGSKWRGGALALPEPAGRGGQNFGLHEDLETICFSLLLRGHFQPA